MKKYGIEILDRELACTYIDSPEEKDYLRAMNAAANFAWANRQCIVYAIRKAFYKLFGEIEINQLYDVAHNIAKEEIHKVNDSEKKVLVHRKGATRAFAPGNAELSEKFQKSGLTEEIPEAYKDVKDVVNVVEGAGLASIVAKLRPIGVVKG